MKQHVVSDDKKIGRWFINSSDNLNNDVEDGARGTDDITVDSGLFNIQLGVLRKWNWYILLEQQTAVDYL